MDVLGSILKKMEKPPPVDEKERKLIKQQREAQLKAKKENEERVTRFREKLRNDIKEFVDDDSKVSMELPPMDKISRAIVHEVGEASDLVGHSFGVEEIDRHVVLYKKDHVPCEAELASLKRGEVYDPNAAKDVEDESEVTDCTRKRKSNKPEKYLQKYEKHFKGLAVAKDAANSTADPKRTYGFVSSEQKKDKRTIEETLADIKARKKKKSDVAT